MRKTAFCLVSVQENIIDVAYGWPQTSGQLERSSMPPSQHLCKAAISTCLWQDWLWMTISSIFLNNVSNFFFFFFTLPWALVYLDTYFTDFFLLHRAGWSGITLFNSVYTTSLNFNWMVLFVLLVISLQQF